jgi:hypothetical protein
VFANGSRSIRRNVVQRLGGLGTVLSFALLTSRETVVTHTRLGQGGGVRQGLPYRHHVHVDVDSGVSAGARR